MNRLLRKQNWRVFRFWEHEVEEDCYLVAQKITSAVVMGVKQAESGVINEGDEP